MYTLRPFRRMKGVWPEQLERFVKAAAGQRRSVRDIELLARAYFLGPACLREAIEAGKLSWSLEQLKCVPEDREGCNEFERVWSISATPEREDDDDAGDDESLALLQRHEDEEDWQEYSSEPTRGRGRRPPYLNRSDSCVRREWNK